MNNDFGMFISFLTSEFDRYLMEHEEIAEKIPKNALVIFEVEGEENFNRWTRSLSEKYREKEQPMVIVKIKEFRFTSVFQRAEVAV